MNDRRSASIVASPILIGAVTTLVTLLAVFLSYNANEGLPYVPTYDIHVELPDAAGLLRGNEVRVGGKRVGIVESIGARATRTGVIAVLGLKLDKSSQPIYSASQVTVRPRSPLGLKYVELRPVRRGRPLKPGATLALSQSRPTVDLDQVLSALDAPTRRSLQLAVAGLGDGFAGRGESLNAALLPLPPLLRHAQAVATNLAAPPTGLRGFVRGADRIASELAPVAPQLGALVRDSSTTAGALASVGGELRDALSGLPPTEADATSTLIAARPVLTDARALVHDIRPGTRVLASAATSLHQAIRAGIPVVRRAVALSDRLNTTLATLDRLASDPATSGTLERLLPTLGTLLPTLRFVVPSQTVCNAFGLWTRNLGSTVSEGDGSGTWLRTFVILEPNQIRADAKPSANLHENTYGNSAAPGQPRECETGNEPYSPGQHFGHAKGNQGTGTEITAPPAGVGGR